MALSEKQNSRYLRNIQLQQIGPEGQEILGQSRVLIIGAGGLGSSAAFYCAAAGIGTVGIADKDIVELSNLQRQILHGTADLGRPKVESAADKLSGLNPEVIIQKHKLNFDQSTASQCIAQYDFIIDATDNFESKFLINDTCVRMGKPFSHAGVEEFLGQTMTILPGKSACYRCVFGEIPGCLSASMRIQRGILGAVAGTIGAIQATECVKYLCRAGKLCTDRLIIYDAEAMSLRTVAVKMKPGCPACSSANN